MRVVQAVGWFYPDTLGGTERYVAALATRLQANGHHVTVAAPDPQAAAPHEYDHDGLHVYRYPIPARPTRDEAQGECRTRGAEHLDVLLERQKPDIFHAHTFVTGLGLHEVAAAKRSGARVIVTTHSASLGYLCQRGTMVRNGDTVCDGIVEPVKCAACALQQRRLPRSAASRVANLPSFLSSGVRRLPGRIATALSMRALIESNLRRQEELLRAVDRFVVLTEWARGALLANGAPAHTVVVNRLGIDPISSPSKRPAAGAPVRFGFVSRFEAIKGAETLARAWALLPADCRAGIEFRGPIASAAEAAVQARTRAIVAGDHRVTFAPAVAPSGVAPILSSYDVLISPSLVVEGGPTVALEAIAAGTPVMASAAGGVAELIEDGRNGRLLPMGDAPALAAAMKDVAGNPDIVEQWRRHLPTVRTMDQVTTDYMEMYGELATS